MRLVSQKDLDVMRMKVMPEPKASQKPTPSVQPASKMLGLEEAGGFLYCFSDSVQHLRLSYRHGVHPSSCT